MSARVGMAAAVLAMLGTIAFAPPPAYASSTTPMVFLTGQLIQLADQAGPSLSAVRTADGQLVPVQASVVENLGPDSVVTLSVVVPPSVRAVAAANGTLTVRGASGESTSTPLDTRDLAAASDGTPEPATSDLGRASAASAVSTGQPLAVSAVLAAADPVGSYAPATRHLLVAIVTPKGWPTPNPITSAQIQSQVANASNYWSTVSSGGVRLDSSATITRYTSNFDCTNPLGMLGEAATNTGSTQAPNTSVVVELPPGISKDLTSHCSYGLATVGANVNGWGALYVSDNVFPVLAHELGHNLSLAHANTLQCPLASDSAFNGTNWTGSGCHEAPYDDGDDVMAASRSNFAPFLSSPQSLRTGLLPASAATVISTVGTSRVTLSALGGRSGVRVAEVVDPTNSITYYVEYRVATAPDTVSVYGDALGVRVLRINPTTRTTVLLDPSPTSSPSSDTDSTLHTGSTFTAFSGAVRVTATSTSPTSATVSITTGIPTPPPSGGFTGMSPKRVLDTRYGTGAPRAKLGAGRAMTLTIPGLPAAVTAVALNVTATDPSATSYLTVYPGGGSRPTASNLNYVRGQTIPNLVVVPMGAGNTVTFYNNAGTVNVVADLVGSYAPGTGAGFTGIAPTRVMDTREGPGVLPAKLGA
ncbi:MAG: hypothetical protein ABI662_08280, partial [Dermatophilaceae bacterium]